MRNLASEDVHVKLTVIVDLRRRIRQIFRAEFRGGGLLFSSQHGIVGVRVQVILVVDGASRHAIAAFREESRHGCMLLLCLAAVIKRKSKVSRLSSQLSDRLLASNHLILKF